MIDTYIKRIKHLFPTLALCGSILVFLFARYHTFNAGIDADEGHFGFLARQILQGKHLYTDYHVNKTPAGMYTIALFFKLFGDSILTIRLLGTIVLILNSFVLYKISEKMLDRKAASYTVALFLVSTLPPSMLYNRTLVEPMATLFILISLLLLIKNPSNKHTFTSGLSLGISFLYKIISIPNAFAITLWLFFTSKFRYKRILLYFISFLLPVFLVSLFLLSNNTFTAFVYSNFKFNNSYISAVPFYLRPLYFPIYMVLENPIIWILGLYGMFRLAITQKQKGQLIAFNILIPFVAILFVGRNSAQHYYQIIPLLVLCTVFAVHTLSNKNKYLLTGFFLLVPAFIYVQAYILSPTEDIVRYACPGNCGEIDYVSENVSDYISTHLNEKDYIYSLGREAQFYYYTNTLPSSRFILGSNLIHSSDTLETVCSDLRENKPKIIINTMPYQYSKETTEYLSSNLLECTNLQIDHKETVEGIELWFIK